MATDRIEVSLPLPQPTLQRLIRAIGAAWPDATIDMSAPNEFSEQARKIAFLVEAVVDPNLPLDMVTFNEQGDLEPLPRDVNPEVIIQRIHDGSFGMAMPEWYCRLQLQAFGEILADPAAVNYVEQQMTHYNEETRSHDVYVVIVGRPKGKTPHELRVAADGRAADAVTLARKLYDLLGPDGHLAVESDFTPEERALLDDPRQFGNPAIPSVERQPGLAVVAAHRHRVYRRRRSGRQAAPGAESIEERGISRADGVDAGVERARRGRRVRRIDDRDPEPLERTGEAGADEAAAHDHRVDVHRQSITC